MRNVPKGQAQVKIMQLMMRYFYNMSDHVGTLQIKSLTYFISV